MIAEHYQTGEWDGVTRRNTVKTDTLFSLLTQDLRA
jgi:hypothetical protein